MKYVDYTGEVLDNRYRILKLLGMGGMGAVYLGEHVVIGKKVAVKFLHAEFVGDSEVVKRFYREAQAAAAVHHKNIIDVADVGVSAANEPYLVMEYLEGESLAAMLERTGPIGLSAACAILEPVLSALQAAHDRGIVHRDLKPENIFLAYEKDGAPAVKLIDFGISKFTASGHSKMTGTGMMLGTPAYMSPEQIRGPREVDHRTDIYAVGVVLYQMLTGKLPFPEEFYNALVYSVMTADPVPPKKAYADFPDEVEALLLRLLSKSADNRPQSANDLLEEIRALSDYENRYEELTRYSSGLAMRGFAGGSLGSSIDKAGGATPQEVLSEMAGKSTPSDWSKTSLRETRHNRYLWGAVAAAAVVIVFLVIGIAKLRNRMPETVVPLKPAPVSTTPPPLASKPPVTSESELKIPSASQATETVRLKVAGAPSDAMITYAGMRMLRSEFSVTKSDVVAELAIRAAGYKDFFVGVVPDRDQDIVVKMEPASTNLKSRHVDGHSASKKGASGAKSDHKTNDGVPTDGGKIIKSGKTKLTESFDD